MSALKTRLATALLFLPALLLSAPFAVAAPPSSHPAAARGIGSAPAGLVAAIARTQAKAAAHNPAYAIAHNGCAQIKTRNTAPVLAGCFGKQSSAFSTGQHTISLRLSAWGRVGHLRPVTLTRSAPQANRIEYRGRHIIEWWRVLPLGYEQGFTLKQAPEGSGQVVLQLSASRAPKIVHGTLAWGKLRYGKLHVTDAAGHILPATLSARGKTITLAFDATHARYPVTIDPLMWVQQEVTNAPGAASNFFGYKVALSGTGTTALVGAYNKTVSGNASQGAAYVYTLSNGTWSQAAELTASNGAANDWFGAAVALSGDGTTVLVGANGNNIEQGAVYIYTAPPAGWTSTSAYTAYLTASNGAANDWFGAAVALSGDGTIALVGAFKKTISGNTGQGAAYVYTAPPAGWTSTSAYTAYLTASNGAASDAFGEVALSRDGATALVGAYLKTVGGNTGQGAAYVYTEPTTGGWVTTTAYTAYLTASNGAVGDRFGASVALSTKGTTALLGARLKTVGTNADQGAAYVFTTTNNWSTSAPVELTASNGAANDSFGWSVALSGDGTTALVGAESKTVGANSNQGAVYGYTASNGSWSQAGELTASDGATNDHFGVSVAISAGPTMLVGAYQKAVGSNAKQGAAYFFTGSDLSAVLNAPAAVGASAQFSSQYILTNASVTASAALTVMLPLPVTHASYVSVTATQGSCTYDTTAQAATCALGSIAGNGGTATASLKLKVTGPVSATIVQSAKLLNGLPDLAQTASTTIVAPPTVSGLSAVTVTAPSAGSEAFTFTGTGALTLTATSSNTTLLPAADITGATKCIAAGSCTLTLRPATGQAGSATVTVTVVGPYGSSGTGTFTFTANKPAAPAASGLSALSVAYGKSGTETFTLAGTGALTLTATSSNTTLLPAADITGAGKCTAAGACVLTLTPVSGQAGSATVTVTVADAYSQSSKGTFTFTANKPAAPAASGLSAITVTAPSAGSETFKLAGTGALTLTATSSNTTLLPAADITGAGKCTAAGACVLTLTPVSGQAGSATVTVTVADAYSQSSKGTFTFTANKPAAPAARGLSAVTVTAPSAGSETFTLAGTGALTLTATSSNTTLLPAADITGAGKCTAAGACVLTLTPVSGQAGSATVTVAVADAYGQSTKGTFTFTVNKPAAPAASGLSALSVAYGKSGTETFTLAGTGALTLTATSSNTTLLPAAHITGAAKCTAAGSCVLTLTPATGQSGTASVTVKVSDSYAQNGSGTFKLTVKAAPPPPPAPSSSGGGALGLWSLLGLFGLALLIGLSRRNARD